MLTTSPVSADPMLALRSAPAGGALGAVIGRAPAMEAVLARALRMAPHPTSVLVTGESGTGKELFARLLHERGPNPGGPFVAVNCGALSRELAESELFGHERGAFTGAAGQRPGWFEEASGGTLVLDEIGELPLELQPKLLRVLETGRLRRVGGRGEIAVKVRIVALTLRELEREASAGRFRLDLFHRLSGFELRLPPLRARREDIPRLCEQFLAEVTREVAVDRQRAAAPVLTPEALGRLCKHDWPGNVRELRNVIRRAAFLGDGCIGPDLLELRGTDAPPRWPDHAAEAPLAPATTDVLPLRGRSFLELQREIFLWALREHGGSRRRAARALGISRSTFCDRVKRLGLAL